MKATAPPNKMNPTSVIILFSCCIWSRFMHNLISHNQLAGSRHTEYASDSHNDLIEEYYECLIECDDEQHICKRICKEVLA